MSGWIGSCSPLDANISPGPDYWGHVIWEGGEMGISSRLFGSGEPRRGAPEISKSRDSGDTKDIWQRIEQEALIAQTTSKILQDYGQVLEAINERRDGYVIGLYPESKLPCPKEVIRAAFAIAFKQMARYGWQQWNGVPKNVLEMAATSLDIHFAPDQEVPDDPVENFAAFNKRQLEQSPEIHAKIFASLKANPEGWNRLLEIAGISKDLRDVIVKLVREKRV